jgi:hypothetical protein
MFQELIAAIFKAALPVGLTSYGLVWWALRNDYLGAVDTLKDVEKGIQRLSKDNGKKKDKDRSKKARGQTDGEPTSSADSEIIESLPHPGGLQKGKLSPVHNKWLSFGGGFYGVVALLTYAVIEWDEIRGLFAGLDGIAGFFQNISVGLLINFFIESLLNLITAITWPIYWLSNVHSSHIWIWFIAAYGGYWLGARLAVNQYKSLPHDTI